MPAGKRSQSNTMLYTLITFVGLFLVTTILSVIYYVQFEKQRDIADTASRDLEKILSKSEQRKGLGKIVGSIPRGKSGLGTMVSYLDEMITLIVGGPLEESTAETKVENSNSKAKDLLDSLAKRDISIENGLLSTLENVEAVLADTEKSEITLIGELDELRQEFDETRKVTFEKEQTLLAEKEKSQQQVEDIKSQYNALKNLMEQKTEQQVQILAAQLDEERAKLKEIKDELLETRAQYKMADNRMKRAQRKLSKLVPAPDRAVASFKSDGKIILINDMTKIVHLNIGSADRVYRGLTFTVYDSSLPIPKDGKGKAEIEIFNIDKNTSTARIIYSKIKNPIILGDNVANLIWGSEKSNEFVVAGAFDIDNNGKIDYNASEKIRALIEKWGGRVADSVSVETDFLVLGKAPKVNKRPSFEEMEMYPLAMDKYEQSIKRLTHYKEMLELANRLSVPIFNYEKFLYFIGYKTQSGKAGAF